MDHPPPTLASTAWQLAAVLALVLANGFFVASEFALVAVRKTRIDQLAAEGSRAAVVVQRAVNDLDRYIAATQVGITIASLMLGGIGERTLEPLLEIPLHYVPLPLLGITRASLATFLAYFIMTSLHVIIGELMPKSIALQKAEAVTLVIGRPMTFCAQVFAPLIWLLNGTGNFLLHRIGFHAADGHSQVHSPEELLSIARGSHEGGEINQTEFEMIQHVIRFSDTTAREVMVPRVEMQALPIEVKSTALRDYLRQHPHTRVPLYRGTVDDIVGIAHLKDLVTFEATLPNEPTSDNAQQDSDATSESLISLMPVVREAARVPETISIDRLLLEFKRQRQQMAIVIDEYGGTSGLITMGDLLEQVFGDVHDEFDKPEPEVEVRSDGRIVLAGRMLIDEVNERYRLGLYSEEVDTIAGLMQEILGRPGAVGDEVEVNNAKLRIEALEGLRITQLSLQLPPDSEVETNGVASQL